MLNDVGSLVARLALGGSIAAHGAQKAWGAFGGPGPQGAAMFMESLGFMPGARYAGAASGSELIAGLLIAAGAGGPLGPALLLSTMVVAQTAVHAKNGYFAQGGGIELGVMYSTAALALATGGYGRFSVDHALSWTKLREPGLTALILAGGVAGGLAVLAQRAPIEVPAQGLDTQSESDTAGAPHDTATAT